jgi:hypothetical protein
LLIDNEHDNEHKLKHCTSEPVIKTDKSKSLSTEIDDNDDDDIWCNSEDEDNLEHRVQLDEQREKYLREVLGDETFAIVRDALKVNKHF